MIVDPAAAIGGGGVPPHGGGAAQDEGAGLVVDSPAAGCSRVAAYDGVLQGEPAGVGDPSSIARDHPTGDPQVDELHPGTVEKRSPGTIGVKDWPWHLDGCPAHQGQVLVDREVPDAHVPDDERVTAVGGLDHVLQVCSVRVLGAVRHLTGICYRTSSRCRDGQEACHEAGHQDLGHRQPPPNFAHVRLPARCCR